VTGNKMIVRMVLDRIGQGCPLVQSRSVSAPSSSRRICSRE
jgi:hypothetical protein